MEDVVIIGAGTSGLALAYELKRRGIVPVIIDQGSRIAETWRQRHPQLYLNTSARISHQRGLRIPRKFGIYPHRDDYIRYLEEYYDFLGIPVRFNVKAERIETAGDHWSVSTNAGELAARHMVVSTGSEKEPWRPVWPGMDEFRGKILHARDFGKASQYSGAKVLVVGAGNSGVDVASCLAKIDLEKAWISVRSGSTIVPRFFLGLSGQEGLAAIRHTPLSFQDAITVFVSWMAFGDLSRYGIPRHPIGPISRQRTDGVTVGIDDGFVAALKAGRFTAVPEVKALTADGVILADEKIIDPDVIICATGYRLGLEELVGHLNALDERGQPGIVPGDERGPLANLWFFGLISSVYGNMNVRRQEAGPLARRIVRSLD